MDPHCSATRSSTSIGTAPPQVADPTLVDWLYTYAWFVTFGLSFILYLGLSRDTLRTLRAEDRAPVRRDATAL